MSKKGSKKIFFFVLSVTHVSTCNFQGLFKNIALDLYILSLKSYGLY